MHYTFKIYIALAAMIGLLIGAVPAQAASFREAPPQQGVTHLLFEVSEFFINPLGDVPLMAGLRVDYDSLIIFDKPDGRFVEIMAVPADHLVRRDVLSFYETSLPRLGWQKHDMYHYSRHDEHLTLSFEEGDSGWIVRFVTSPVKK